jgi:N-acetylmuramoyl-L-alanine amidase
MRCPLTTPAGCSERGFRGVLPGRWWVLAWVLCLLPLSGMALPLVVLDPGHGGSQDGAKGVRQKEKELTLEVTRKVQRALEGKARVVLTRERDADLSLAERVARTNAEGADLFVSIHANSMPTRQSRARTHGVETYFLSLHASDAQARRTAAKENGDEEVPVALTQSDALSMILDDLARQGAHQDSALLAETIHTRLVKETGANDRGVQQAPFYVLAGVEAPAVLVEIGYLTHPEEGVKLASAAYQDKIARALARGITAFLSAVAERDVRPPAGTASAAP